MILNQILQPSSPSTSQSAVEALKSKLQSLNNSPKAKITIKSSKHRLSLSPKKAGHNDLSRLKVPAIPKDERSKSALQKSQAGMENFLNKKYIQEHPPSYPSIKVNSQPLVEIVNASDKIKLRGVSHIQKKIKESSDDIVNELRHLSFARCDSREDTSTFEEISSHIVKKGSSFDLTSFNKTYKVINNIKDKLQKREELISSMFMANNNKYTKDKYQDFDLKFAKTPIELREEILKGEGYNVNETDSVQEVWKKTKNAMKLIKDEEENEKRNLRRQEQYSRVDYSTDENMAVECLRVNNIVNDFVFDTAGFNRVLQESQVELDEKINKSMEKSMEQRAKKLNKLASCQGARKSQTSFISRPKTSNNNQSFELKKEQKKHKEEFEKQQKMELQAKMRDIDRKLETKQKRYQMMGIFSEEKNKTRIEAEKFVASFKEKSKFEANLFRFLQGAATNVPPPGKDSIVPTKSPSSKSLTSQNQSMYEQSQYERIKKIPENSVMNQLSDVLTRPVKDTLGEKIVRVGVYQKRLTDLRRKLNHTRIEKMSSDFTRLQFL